MTISFPQDRYPATGSDVWLELVRKQLRLEEMTRMNFTDQFRIPMVLSFLSMRHYTEFHSYIQTFNN